MFETLDGYCERLDASFWSEPVNAVTNLAFVLAAYLMWRRTRGDAMAGALCLILAMIGLGSFAFHTFAQVWAAIADVAPIVAYILLYVFVANRYYLGMRLWPALGLTALFVPYAALTVPLFAQLEWLRASAGYAPVPVLIAAYAVILRKSAPKTAAGLALGATILVVSIAFRTIDSPLCARVPLGTHFLWHILNGIMLGWMIEVYHRHRLAGAPSHG